MIIFLISLVAFATVMLAMAIGVMLKGRCLRGSCGGAEIIGPDGELLNCDTCPARKERERRERVSAQGTHAPVIRD